MLISALRTFSSLLCFLHREGISGPLRVIPGEWQDQRTEVQMKRADDVRRTFYKAVSRSSFRLKKNSGFLFHQVRSEKAFLPGCGEPFRAFENVLIWSDATKPTYFSCPSFCLFLIVAGIFSEGMCLIRTFWQVQLRSAELRSEAAWIWSLLSEFREGSNVYFLSNPKSPSTRCLASSSDHPPSLPPLRPGRSKLERQRNPG